MTTPTKAQRNLVLARWAFPEYEWLVGPEGEAVGLPRFAGLPRTFDISDPNDQSQVRIKLSRDHNITIHERKRSGRAVWEAVTRDGGSTEHESLEILLWQVVEKILEGGE